MPPSLFTVTGILACRSAPRRCARRNRWPATWRPKRGKPIANGGRRFPAANPGRGLDGGYGPDKVAVAEARQQRHAPAAFVAVDHHPRRVDRVGGHDLHDQAGHQVRLVGHPAQRIRGLRRHQDQPVAVAKPFHVSRTRFQSKLPGACSQTTKPQASARWAGT